MGALGAIGSYYNQNAISYAQSSVLPDSDTSKISPTSDASETKKAGRTSSPADCQTCKERKYQDGSDEMVSFKSASHISPEASMGRVMAHEQEHVSNAYSKAAQKNGEVISANVSLKSAICPECGRSYISGGETRTQIKYTNESNPYQQDKKALDSLSLTGMNINTAC
ncbi:MAG: hypothetical protein HGA25_00795 [Clostridiales bacterium]|nr:hypothetical protein [Clostridiales bacterium]